MAGKAVLPREAIAFLRAKGLKPSRHWLSVWREEHASAFTVAQMTRQDLLRQTHRELQRVLRKGETFESFQERLQPWLEAKGWAPTGRGGDVPTRLRRIYHTNLRAAHLAGQWDGIQRTKQLLPWLVYGRSISEEKRQDHLAWVGLCLRADDPWWNTHYPPNGWGCKCWVRQVAEPPAGTVTRAPRIRKREWANPATGEIVEVPEGIDPGWDYNAAAHAGLGTVQALTDRLQRMAATSAVAATRMPAAAARQRLAEMTAAAQRRVADLEEDLRRAQDAHDDPTVPYRSGTLARLEGLRRAVDKAKDEVSDVGRRAILWRSRPAAFADGEPSWQGDGLKARWGPELAQWRRMVHPRLARQALAPRIRPSQEKGLSSARYPTGLVQMDHGADPGTMVHELSHLLEADRETLERAVAFLSRRTAGDPIEAVLDDYLGRRDKFHDPRLDAYAGRIYPASAAGDAAGYHRTRLAGAPGHPPAQLKKGDRGDIDVSATEILSMGMERLWRDPQGFARADPEYFDFIWDTVVRGSSR